jgi:hypothetical protein
MSIFSSSGRDATLLSPCHRRKLSWDALGKKPCGALPLVPPLPSVSPSDRCSYGVRPNSMIEGVKISRVVVGGDSSACDVLVSVRVLSDTEFLMKVVNFFKLSSPEVTLRELWSICAVHRRLRRDELSSYRSLRMLEWRRPHLLHQCAHRSSSCLCFLLMSVGRSRCYE